MTFRSLSAAGPHQQTSHSTPNPKPRGTKNTSSQELRKETRYPIEAPAFVRWEGRTRTAKGMTRDISSGGIFIYGDFAEVPVGTYIEVMVYLRSEGLGPKVNIVLTAKVARIEGGELPGLAAANHRTAIRKIGPLDLLG